MATPSLPYTTKPRGTSTVEPAHLMVLISLSGAALLWGWFLIFRQHTSLETRFLLLVGLFGVASACFVFTRVRGDYLRFFDLPIFLTIVVFVRFGLVPVGSFVNTELLNPSLHGNYAPLVHALQYVMLGMVAFWLGCSLIHSKEILGTAKANDPPARANLILPAGVALYAVSFATKLYMLSHHLYSYIASGRAYNQNLAAAQVLMSLANLGTYALIILCIEKYWHPGDRVCSRVFWIVFCSECFWGFISGMKELLFVNFVYIAIISSLTQRRFRKGWILAALVGVTLFYPISNRYRDLVGRNGTGIASFSAALGMMNQALNTNNVSVSGSGGQSQKGWKSTLTRMDLLQSVGLLMSLGPKSSALRGEERWWMVPYYPFIPRFIWNSKPVLNKGQRFSTALGYGAGTSTAVTYPGELYVTYGLPGLLAGMFLLGTVAQWLANGVKGLLNKRDLFVYAAIFFTATNMEIDSFSYWSTLIKSLIILSIIAFVVYGPRRQVRKVSTPTKNKAVAQP